MSVGLLDVNMLIALAWPTHVHHRKAHNWFASNSSNGWATCPLTQNGFVRVSSNPKIIPYAVTPADALVLLKEMVSLKHHIFWPDDIPIHNKHVPSSLLAGHRQVTDAYLLGLAIHHKGKLVTFDKNIATLVPQDSMCLEVLSV